MVVILLRDVKGLGRAGEVVKVNDGYARNFLFPKAMATPATDGNIKNVEQQKKILVEKRDKELASAEALAGKIGALSVKIMTKSGENGRLFGSITSKDIADALKAQHKIDIDKRKIVLESPIKNVGESSVEIKLYHEVTAVLKVVVEA
ncbi:MAG: 50S ribosomal protein L9 [Clostridiales Family XIII bacterium]|jgi:large subunit ribosomal protein L9|nr:50S ribosomal protein L9 [Clostridiales Family XIII bacterium]